MKTSTSNQDEYVLMYPCRECGEDVEARECYEEFGTVMHAIGVTGQAEPHETGAAIGDLKEVNIQNFDNSMSPGIRHLVRFDLIDYFRSLGLAAKDAENKAEEVLVFVDSNVVGKHGDDD